jgi:hypothetical protein
VKYRLTSGLGVIKAIVNVSKFLEAIVKGGVKPDLPHIW